MRPLALAMLLTLGGCHVPAPAGVVQAPLAAVCSAKVTGLGLVDAETDYLPGVVHCENGAAPPEALRAQAIAARTYLYFKMETTGEVADGQSDQVYTCGSAPTFAHVQAVRDTAGMVLRYHAGTIAAFYVAGGAAKAPGCVGATATTEKYVTYNEGLSGAAVHQSSLGLIDPSNDRNRGCMSQLGSTCLAGTGLTYDRILRFYYGADIGIEQATGACIPTMDAGTVDASPGDASAGDAAHLPGDDESATKEPGGCDVAPGNPERSFLILLVLAAWAVRGIRTLRLRDSGSSSG